MGLNYLSIPKLQRCNRWSLGMDKLFHPTPYWACDYLLGSKLKHVSKRGYWGQWGTLWFMFCTQSLECCMQNDIILDCICIITALDCICHSFLDCLSSPVNMLKCVRTRPESGQLSLILVRYWCIIAYVQGYCYTSVSFRTQSASWAALVWCQMNVIESDITGNLLVCSATSC